MADFINRLMIEKPLPEVFDFVADFKNLSLWNYYVMEAQQTSAGPPGLGATYHLVRKTDQRDLKVIEWVPNMKAAFQVQPPAPPLIVRFAFEAAPGGTRLADQWELKGPLGFVAGLGGFGKAKGAVAENLQKLKQLLETGQVELQDGRLIQL
jgi:hypothetical protein